MYDELVKALREADEKSMCGECGLNLHGGSTKKGVLFAKAADAIEELIKDRDNWEATAKKEREMYWHWFDQYQKDVPRWNPVTERLPEETAKVLVQAGEYYYKNSSCKGIVVGWRNGPYWSTFTAKGCESIRYPLAWMPLPQPPKEET